MHCQLLCSQLLIGCHRLLGAVLLLPLQQTRFSHTLLSAFCTAAWLWLASKRRDMV